MRTDAFDYPLPESAIAQRMLRHPVPPTYSGKGRLPFPPREVDSRGATLSPCGDPPGVSPSLRAGQNY